MWNGDEFGIELNRGLMSHSTTTVISATYANVYSRQVHKLLARTQIDTVQCATMYRSIQTMIAGLLLMCPVFILQDKANGITQMLQQASSYPNQGS